MLQTRWSTKHPAPRKGLRTADALLHVATTDPDAGVRDSARMQASTFTKNTDKIRAHYEDLVENETEEEKTRAAGLLHGLDSWKQIKQQQEQEQ
jgi:hypothetical protein